MICKECRAQFEKDSTNQVRCRPCIDRNPHHGRHEIGKLGDAYVRRAKVRLAMRIRHWNISMGYGKLVEMFPDLEGR